MRAARQLPRDLKEAIEMKGILPNCLTHLFGFGNPDGIGYYCTDPSLARGMTEDELADYQRRQMEGAITMASEKIGQWVVDNEMKNKDGADK